MRQLELGEKPPEPETDVVHVCSWCLAATATTKVVGTHACAMCAAGGANYRVIAWLRAVGSAAGAR